LIFKSNKLFCKINISLSISTTLVNEFKSLCPNIEFHDLKTPADIELSYKYATKEGGIHVLVEYPELYYIN
jgi:hypothetical protein